MGIWLSKRSLVHLVNLLKITKGAQITLLN